MKSTPGAKPVSVPLAANERSVGELFRELASETSTLVRQEVQLAKTELTEKATFAAKQSALVAAGSLLGATAVVTLFAALILALGTIIPLWVSALVVGIVVGAMGGILVRTGISALQQMDPAPRQTLRSMEEGKSWVLHQIR